MTNDEMFLQLTGMIKGLSDDLSGFKDEVNSRFDQMDGRLDQMDGRLDQMDERLDQMDGRLDKMVERFDGVDSRLDRIENQVKENYNAIEQLMYDQKDMRKEITGIQLRMENEVQRNFSILADSAISDANRLHALEEDVRDIKDERVIDVVIQGLRERKLIN